MIGNGNGLSHTGWLQSPRTFPVRSYTQGETLARWRRLATLVCIGLVALLGPGLFGTVQPGPVIVVGILLSLGMILQPGSRLRRRSSLAFWLVSTALAMLILIALLQVLGQGEPLQINTKLPGTANSGATERAIGPLLAMLLAFVLGWRVASTSERAWRLVAVLAGAGCLVTFATGVQHILDPLSLLWLTKRSYIDSFTGPFINRNTAAVYVGLTLLCVIGAGRATLAEIAGGSTGLEKRRSLAVQVRWLAFLAIIAALVLALVLTRSRAGIVLSLLTVSLFVLLLLLRRRLALLFARKPLLAGIVILSAGAVIAVVAAVGVDVVGERGTGDGGRMAVYRASLMLALQHPWWGTGLGTFVDVFPAVRPEELSSWGVWDRAHNTLIELCVEAGFPAAAIASAAVVAAAVELTRGMRQRRKHFALPALGAMAGLLVGGHSLVDFSLQIPGLAVVFFLLLGACLGQTEPRFGSTMHGEIGGNADGQGSERG